MLQNKQTLSPHVQFSSPSQPPIHLEVSRSSLYQVPSLAQLPEMRIGTPPRPPSEGEDINFVKLSVKPSLPESDSPPPSKVKKNKDGAAQETFNVKGRREESFPVSSSLSKKKRSTKRQRKSGIDLEELPVQAYPKEISVPVKSAKQTPAEGSGRRSNRSNKRPPKSASYSAKKWSGDEEISLSMALLEGRRSPDRRININAFYQRAKESLHDEVSDYQLYDKMRSMNRKFKAMQANLKENNVAEDEVPNRTHKESALFRIWEQIWGNNDDNHGIYSGNITKNGVQDLSEFENPRKHVVETLKEIENGNPRGNGGQTRNEDSMGIEGENPGEYEAETARERGTENPTVKDKARENSGETEDENPRGVEGENSGDIGSENPKKVEVTKPRGSGVEKQKEGEEQNQQISVSREKEGEVQNLQNSVSHETQNIEDNRVRKLQKCKSGRLGDNINILREKTGLRLQASIESSIDCVAVPCAAGANFRPLGGFGVDTGMEVFRSRKMDDSVKGLPGLNSVEARELQQKWRALKIQEVRMFCESLESLQKQCRLFLKNAENSSSSDNHGS